VISDQILVLFPVYTSLANAYPDGMFTGSEKLATPKSQAESPQDVAVDRRISLVRGGPFYRAQEAIRLLDANRWNLGRRITLAIVVCWVPLVLITLLLNPHAIKGLLSDYPVNVRLLFAIPVLLGGQVLMELILSTALPMLPTVLAEIPFIEVLKG
jgi:hypothetical protein